MKLLTTDVNYESTIKLAQELNDEYNKSVIFHCYWYGELTEKHVYSIISCYYFNVFNKKHKIILWLENNKPNKYNEEIAKYAEIKYFNKLVETKDTFLENYNYNHSQLVFYADYVRSVLLYKYGGCWFDLDCLFLRSFEPLFSKYENNICLYQWENQNYPNNAIYISLEPKSIKMRNIIDFIIQHNSGWGFQEAKLYYNLPLDILVLPCSWFDGSWINNPYNLGCDDLFKDTDKIYTFDNFFNGAFCYHWHNRWNRTIEENSILKQLVNIIYSKLS